MSVANFSYSYDAWGKLISITGSVIKQGDILSDSFSEFEPQDIDGDGVFEIVCLQYVSLLGHSDCIGNAKSILKFNSDTQKFAVITAEFIAEK